MAEGEKRDESWGGWFGSLVSTAKEQTEKVFEIVSHDLDEFTSTMQSDTKKVVAQTAETLKSDSGATTTRDKMKQGFSSLMEGITKVLTVEPDEAPSPQAPKHRQPHTGIFDRAQTRLRAVQVDTGTYLNEPSGPSAKFEEWQSTFDLDEMKGQISDLLVSMVEVRSLYTTLVPSQVSHQDFWQRYFYKVHQLEVDEARKQALMERSNTKEDSISWDDEEWSGDESSLSGQKPKQSPNVNVMSGELEERLSASLATESGETTDRGVKVDEQSRDEGVSEINVTKHKVETQSENITVNQPGTIPDIVCDKTVTIEENTVEENVSMVIYPKTEAMPAGITSQDQTSDGVTTLAPSTRDKSAESPSEKSAKSPRDKNVITLHEKNAESLSEKSAIKSQREENAESPREKSAESPSEKSAESLSEVQPASSEEELKIKVKGDLVVVATDRISPSSESSDNKESSSDDWERDFDVELTEDDIKAAADLAKQMNVTSADYAKITGDPEEDWENWN